MEDCIFCKIANNEVPTLKVYEDSLNMAFLDINPCSPGHTVIIPKKHYQKLEEMPEEETKELFSVIYKLVKIVPKVVGTTDCNIGLNNGKAAGQEVPHLHFHIIPRFNGDGGLPIQGLVRLKVNKEELPKLAEKIKGVLNEIKKPDTKKETQTPNEEKVGGETKSSEREWQEFIFEEQDKAPNLSEVRTED